MLACVGAAGAHQASLGKLSHDGKGGVARDGVVPDSAIILEGHVDLVAAQGALLRMCCTFRRSILCAKVPARHSLLILCHLVAVLVQWRSLGCMRQDGLLQGGRRSHPLQEGMLEQGFCRWPPCGVLHPTWYFALPLD